jgi:hypothetical protein
MLFTYYNDVGVTIPEGTVLVTFSCIAKAEGTHEISLFEVLPFNSEFEEFTPSVKTLSVTVAKKSEQGGEDPTVTQPIVDPTQPSTDPTQSGDENTEPSTEPQPTEPSDGTEPTDPTPGQDTTPTEPDATEDTEGSEQAPSDETEPSTTENTVTVTEDGSEDKDGGSGLTVLWIVLAVAAVAGGVAVVLYLRKKKNT